MTARDLDAFWSPQIEVECAVFIADKLWNSVAAMTREVDLVAIGRPVAISERWDGHLGRQVTVVDIALDEVIRGTPVTRPDGLIELETYEAAPFEAELGLPSNRHLLFLDNVAAARAEDDEAVRPTDVYSYKSASLYQNILVELDGTVFVPAVARISRDETNAFPSELHGRPFERILNEVREAAAGRGNAGPPAASVRFAC